MSSCFLDSHGGMYNLLKEENLLSNFDTFQTPLCLSLSLGQHAGRENAYEAMVGRADKLMSNTGSQMGQQGTLTVLV